MALPTCSPHLEDAVRLQHEVGQVGAHQREAEHGHVGGAVLERQVGHVARRHPLVGGHQVEGEHPLPHAGRQPGVPAAQVDHQVTGRPVRGGGITEGTLNTKDIDWKMG